MNVRRIVDYDVLILVSLIWFLGKFVRYLFPPLFDPLQASYGVSNATIGTAYTGLMIMYALMQFPSGAVADRIGPVRVIVAGATVASVGSLALVFDSPFLVLVAAMLVIGVGTGVHKTVAVRLLARVYPARTGRMLGVHDAFGGISGVAAPAIVVLFLSGPPALSALLDRLPGADWRGVFLLTGILAFVLAVAFALRVPDRLPSGAGPRADDGIEPGAHDYLALLRKPRFTAFVLVNLCTAFAYNGMVVFLPLYLSREVGMATSTANLIYSVVFLVTFVQLISGELSDRIGRYPVMVVTLGLAAVALVTLVSASGTGVGTLGFGLIAAAIGLGSHGFRPVRSAYLMEILPDWLAGGGLGVVRTLLMGAGALAPGIVGVVADLSGFRPAFGILAASMTLAAVGAAALWATE